MWLAVLMKGPLYTSPEGSEQLKEKYITRFWRQNHHGGQQWQCQWANFNDAQDVAVNGETAETVATSKDVVDTRPRRNVKLSTKSLENYMQNSSQGLEKLWGKVTSSISSMQTTQTFWKRYDY